MLAGLMRVVMMMDRTRARLDGWMSKEKEKRN